jgi:hypothetical protein
LNAFVSFLLPALAFLVCIYRQPETRCADPMPVATQLRPTGEEDVKFAVTGTLPGTRAADGQ